MIAQLNHMNSDTPSDIAARVAARITEICEELNKVDYCLTATPEETDLRTELAGLYVILNAANRCIGFLNEEFNSTIESDNPSKMFL